ncbi:Prostaglandin reductase 1 [Amphibalanus amphitrite]|uniref:Prostaglandin reductase 1 n=1 Tax=Amphibalanus amphitrite TaxID=1232801 RepID=A0A6A4VK62_AMPAM|nr:prostaglandin reductase 1-like [Amphibalanus amphitrite]KAF0294876.1 Prostaglandin reductase 1 [Amphibalanus amphitrite]
MKAEKFTLVRHFDGFPKTTDFKLESEELPPLKDGEVLCEAEFLSVDPYMRGYVRSMTPPVTMIGSQIAKVIDSKNKEFPKGSYVFGQMGWRSLSVVDLGTKSFDKNAPESFRRSKVAILELLPDLGDLPRSYGLGVCGMPGTTAYFGFLELCQPKEGETVVVTGAAGAVGSLVGQIAKIKGCRVIGFAGTDDKCAWLRQIGFDVAINYKTCADIDAALKEAAPKGIDCYFDNVGGMLSHRIRQQMNLFGRISVCGSISSYNNKTGEVSQVPVPESTTVSKQLRIEGFNVTRWWHRKNEAIMQMATWVREGKIKVQEHVTQGFHKMPQAFIGMLKGDNTGKAIVKA